MERGRNKGGMVGQVHVVEERVKPAEQEARAVQAEQEARDEQKVSSETSCGRDQRPELS